MYYVKSRKLEEFLHVHMIYWISQDKDEFGDTVWAYEDSEELRRIVSEYKALIEQKRRLSNAKVKSSSVSRFYRKPQE